MTDAAPALAGQAAIGVLIVHASGVARSALARLLSRDPAIRIVARAPNGPAAAEALRQANADIVLLDMDLSDTEGLTALPRLLQAAEGGTTIIASTSTEAGAARALRALQLGAADHVIMPPVHRLAGDLAFGADLIARLRALAGRRPMAQPPPPTRPAGRKRPRILALGSSTGGPNALLTLVAALPASLPLPVVITQHMPSGFVPILADHLRRAGQFSCAAAEDNATLRPGHILIAPGDRHLLVRRAQGGLVAQLSDAVAENFCRPSVDPMLRSAVAATDGHVLAVILTGMGQDGLAGARDVVESGGTVIVQDEATSVVWGMPGAVARAGLAHAVLPLPQIPRKLVSLIGDRA